MQLLNLPDVGLKLLEGTMFPILPWAVLPGDLDEVEKKKCLLEKNIYMCVCMCFFESG